MSVEDTKVTQVIHNVLTKSDFEGAESVDPTQLYYIDPEFTGSKALVTDSNGEIVESAVTSTELSYIDGVTSNIQTQLNSKISGITSSDVTTALGYTPYNSTNPNDYQTSTQVSSAISAHHDSTKQDKLTAVSPITITQETVSPTHNYTISGTTASPTYTSYSINDYYSVLAFGDNNMGSTPSDFSDWCNNGQVSWIDIPVDFSSESLTATVGGGTNHTVFVYGAKSGSTFEPYFTAYCYGSSLAGYCITSLNETGTNSIQYNTTRTTPEVTSSSTSESNHFTVTLTDNSSSVSFAMEEVDSGSKYTGTGSVSVSGSQVAYFSAVNCIRIFVFTSVSTTTTTYGSSWTLANGTTTSNNLSVSYDEETITKNSEDKLQASSLVGLTASVDELNYVDGATSNLQNQINKKQDTLTAVSPISISQTTTSPTHNVTIVNDRAGFTAIGSNFSFSWGDAGGTCNFTGNTSSATYPTATTFDESCYDASYIKVPVNLTNWDGSVATLTFDDIYKGGVSNFTGPICDYILHVYGKNDGTTFNPKFACISYYQSNAMTGNPTSAGEYARIFYNVSATANASGTSGSTTDTKHSMKFKLSYDANGAYIAMTEVYYENSSWKEQTYTWTYSSNYIDELKEVNEIRLIVTTQYSGDLYSCSASTTTWDLDGWTLADGTSTTNNISVGYDDSTIKLNDSNQLYVPHNLTMNVTFSDGSTGVISLPGELS